MLKNQDQRGFTLIELLIVIVIIGILAGVLIAIINPAQQQNRARDAGVQATMNKVALATEGFISAYGRAPTGSEFFGSLQNASDPDTTCLGSGQVCTFDITGNTLPTVCEANGWQGTSASTGDCYYHYWGGTGGDSTHFRIVARSFGIVDTSFVYDNTNGAIQECPSATVSQSASGGC